MKEEKRDCFKCKSAMTLVGQHFFVCMNCIKTGKLITRDLTGWDYGEDCCIDKQRVNKLDDAANMLWIVLANVSEGDWTKQPKEWQKAAARWRDNYFKIRKELKL